MTMLSPALDNALAGFNPSVFGAVRIELPGKTIALLDGSATLVFDGKTYVGQDADYGTLGAIDSLSEGTGDSAPALSITLYPPTDAAAAALSSPTYQGAPVYLHAGAVDPATGLVIGYHLMFVGEIDVPTLRTDRSTRSLELEVVSVFQRFFMDEEGIRLSPDWHKEVWPGETGLDDMSSVAQTDYWGTEAPAPSIKSQSGGTASDAYIPRGYEVYQ